jgi:superfamily II DNA or RNA helicase
MTKLKPFDYQTAAIRAAFAAWDRGERAALIHAPTGAGKSLIFAKSAGKFYRDRGGRALVLAQDSRELVTQAADNLRRHTRMSVGVEMGPERVKRDALPAAVCATVQTMARRLAEFPRDAFSLLVFDEADHSTAKTWRKIAAHFWAARILGCTATPVRHDGAALGTVFESAHQAATHRQLIDAGRIAPIRQQSVRVLDLSALVMPPGADPDPATLGRIMEEERHLHAVVEPTRRLAEDRATIVFAVTVDHARQLAALFNRYAPGTARAVWGAMPKAERAETMRAFQAREFQFLVNVAVLGRGVDLPFVSCVAMARPTQSAPFYEHAIGRGWRAHPGKADLLVLDFCDNAEKHALVSTIDVLAGKEVDEETKERARERLAESGGGDVLGAIDAAGRDLIDPSVRARVRAKVNLRTRAIDPFRWATVDWANKTNREIAREIGMSASTVSANRPRDVRSPGIGRKFDWWKDVDWAGSTNKQISEKYGCSLCVVTARRRRVGIPLPGRAFEISKIDWGDIDWRMSNAAIGRLLGVSPQVVSSRRPPAIPPPSSAVLTKASRIRWGKVNWRHSNREIAADLGVSHGLVASRRPANKPSPYRWREGLRRQKRSPI